MKITIQLFITLAICITCTSLSCQKEKDELPRATQEGKNTFGCKIDGKLFVSKNVITVPVTPGLSSYYDESTKRMRLYAVEPPNEEANRLQRHVTINIYDLKIGNNVLNNINKQEIVIVEINQLDKYYETNASIGGTLNITRLDTVANIISGTFSFQAAPRFNPGPNISVTDGRFDITYQP